jgi:hypothetical protein
MEADVIDPYDIPDIRAQLNLAIDRADEAAQAKWARTFGVDPTEMAEENADWDEE